jgi:hypothetical protein
LAFDSLYLLNAQISCSGSPKKEEKKVAVVEKKTVAAAECEKNQSLMLLSKRVQLHLKLSLPVAIQNLTLLRWL